VFKSGTLPHPASFKYGSIRHEHQRTWTIEPDYVEPKQLILSRCYLDIGLLLYPSQQLDENTTIFISDGGCWVFVPGFFVFLI